MKTLNANQDTEHKSEPDNVIEATAKLRPTPMPPLSREERAAFAGFIRDKRVAARAEARAKGRTAILLDVLEKRKSVELNGANVGLARWYDYKYGTMIEDLEEALELAREMERKLGRAKAEPRVGIAFHDVNCKKPNRKMADVAEAG